VRVIFRTRARTLAVVAAVAVTAGMGTAVTVLAAHSQHGVTLSAATSTKLGANAALPHSPQLLHQLAGPATGTGVRAASTSTGTAASAATTAASCTAASGAPGPAGVDVASFQHPNGLATDINWTQVAGSGCKFAAVKATEGHYYSNPYFAGDIAGASAAGLYPMAYHFGIPNTSTPAAQADYFLAAAQGSAGGATPQIMLDIEYDPNTSSDGANECYNLTPAQMVSWITAFNNEIRLKAGQSPLIYTTADWWNTCTGDSTAFSASQLWIATYGTSPILPAAWPTWTLWQYTSSGAVPGIIGNVDISYFNDAAGTLGKPRAQAAAVGAPVWLQVPSLVGSAPFSATGLPPGLSLNTSTGLISGWLTTAGTYTATVSAATAPFPAAATSTSVTWTVSAAPNSGPTGRVVLQNGGKCLDDTGYHTANGTRVDIWTCVGSTNQSWTMAQDHTVRIFGKCLGVSGSGTANNTAVVLWTCNGSTGEQWQIGLDAQLVNPHSGKCLDDPGRRTTNGTLLDIYSCVAGATNEHWTAPAGEIVSQIAPLCVDDPGSHTADGTRMDVWSCVATAKNEAWTVEPDGTVRVFGKCLDVYGSGTANGTPVDLFTCNGTGAQKWNPRADGTLQNPQSGRCLTDPGDNAQNGTRLVIFDCSAAAGEDWAVR
jgi:GH25 family lysozyme M1 (1,4-beta-N-acetylmuramidase)